MSNLNKKESLYELLQVSSKADTSEITAASGYLFDYLVVNAADTTIETLTDENNVSLVEEWGLTSKNLSPGILLIGKNGARIRAVKVTDGSVIGYQSRDYGNLRV